MTRPSSAGRFDRLVYIGEPTFEDRKKIIHIHTRFMPLEGSALEEIMHCRKATVRKQSGSLLKNWEKTGILSIEDHKTTDRSCSKQQSGISVGIRRRRFIELLQEKNLVFADPARDGLHQSFPE